MKIAYLASDFPSHVATFITNEVEGHHQAGIDILPLSCDRQRKNRPLSQVARTWEKRTVTPPGAWAQLCKIIQVVFLHPLAMLHNTLWLLGLLCIAPVEFLKGLRELSTAACLAPACRAHGTELIHVHFASRALTAGIMLGRLTNTPVSCTAHAFELWGRSSRNLRYRMKRCAFIAAISQYNVDYLRRKCGDEIANLCRVVHCGIDLSEFDSDQRTPVQRRIVLISQMTEKKGHRYLIDACGILKKRNIPYECVLIGTGPQYTRCQQHIEQLGLGDSVRLVGPVANDQLHPYLNSAAVFALPSVVASDGDQDGIPVALMEAMACGIPVISTTVSGIPELLRNGEAGLLVPERDSAALANALERLFADHKLATRLAVAGRQVVHEDFDIRKTTKQLRRLFAEVIESRSI